MPKGVALPEDVKKKISEALKKNKVEKPVVQVKRSAEAQTLFNDYQSSRTKSNELRGQAEKLMADRKGLKRGKASSTKRKAINAKLKELQAQMKAEREKRQAIVEQARAARRVKRAEAAIVKSNLRGKQIDGLETRLTAMLAKAKTPEQKERIRERMERIKGLRSKQKEVVDKAGEIIKAKGQIEGGSSGKAFEFEEHLAEQTYTPWRALTEQEKRVDFEQLNEEFNNLEDELEAELIEATQQEADAFLKRTEGKISAGDIAAIGALLFMIRTRVRASVDKTLTKSYEAGKKMAAREMGVETPSTPTKASQLKALDAGLIAEGFAAELEKGAKSIVRNGIATDASTSSIIAAARDAITEDASKMITNVSGTVVGQYVNEGRRQVFLNNIKQITKFQRSEVLDMRTCEICLSLDKRVVDAHDPMAEMSLVHTHCRGLWVPVFTVEEQPDNNPIPKTVANAFKTVDGRPMVNSFKQLKKPIQKKSNQEAQAVIKRRLETKK